MKRLWLLLPGVAVIVFAARGYPASFKFLSQTLTVPDGFVVELVAAPPLVDRPISAAFDEQGRLYVTDSSGSNDPVEQQLREKPHRVLRLEDTDGDGRFDRRTVFADRMMFPEGALWYAGALYVAAPPSIWQLADLDGDGVADRRTEWFNGQTLTGCANDLHGPYLGPDGWVYWCKGAFAQQTYLLDTPRGPRRFVTRAAHIFRARPNGSGIEPVLTGGMDNPVGLAFTPGGERMLVGTFFHHPEAGKRDGIIHAIYGGVYGKVNDVLQGHPRTGSLMPVMTQLGPAAPCSVIRYRSPAFGPAYQDNLFVCLFNLHKVTRHILVPDGATFYTRDRDFLTSDNPDFHPTCILEDADGSLLVVDTGGWYKLCCPTSQLAKPDVLGAIYRVRRLGAPKPDDPRGRRFNWPHMHPGHLARLLGDRRPFVRDRAVARLGQLGSSAVPALSQAVRHAHPASARRNALWALTRIDSPGARAAVRTALDDPDETVRHVALASISLWRDAGALADLLRLLPRVSPPLERVAAEALGRIEDQRAVPALLAATATQHDRVLEHSLIYALIEIDDPAATAAGLHSPSPLTRSATLIALDQMEHGGLRPEAVAPLLTSTQPALKQTAVWIINHRPGWAPALAGFFQSRLTATDLSDADRAELERQLAAFAGAADIQRLLVAALADSATPTRSRLSALRAMAQAGLKETPTAWAVQLTRLLQEPNPDLIEQAVATARAVAPPKTGASALGAALLHAARTGTLPTQTRLDALVAVPGGLTEVGAALFKFLYRNLDSDKPVLVRDAAATVISKATLTPAQLATLTDAFKNTGPMEIAKLLAAFDRTNAPSIGFRLVAALKESKALVGLRPDQLKACLAKYPPAVQQQGSALLTRLAPDTAKEQARLEQLLVTLPAGDIRRGQAVFNSPKVACSTCHAIGYLGGHVGPDLTRIGQIRTKRDLLESILYPSASFVRSFEPMRVETKDGNDYNGIVRKDTPAEIVLVTGPNAEVRIARNEIADMRPGTVSVMPSGLVDQLTPQQLADLLAFLQATKWGAR